MLASLSHVLGTGIVPHLKVIIDKMLTSLRSSEGVKVRKRNPFVSGAYVVSKF